MVFVCNLLSLIIETRKYPGFSSFECRVSGRVRVLTLRSFGGFGWPKMSGLPAGFSGFGSPRASLPRTSLWSVQKFQKHFLWPYFFIFRVVSSSANPQKFIRSIQSIYQYGYNKMLAFNYKILAIFMNIIVIVSSFKTSNSSKLENCVKSREKRLVSGINIERVTSIIFGPEFISNDMTFRIWLISDRIFGYIIGGSNQKKS